MPTAHAQAGVSWAENINTGTINLYEVYGSNFMKPMVSSDGAAKTLPTWHQNQLEYHIGWYDKNVFTVIGVTSDGVLTYTVNKGADVTMGSFFNIILKVKDTALSPGVDVTTP